MDGIGHQLPPSSSSSSGPPPPPPSINPPSRTSIDSLFNGVFSASAAGFGFSPCPMILVSNFFNDNDDFKSFSQLLAGAMPSDGAAAIGLKQDMPSVEHQSPMFMLPPGLFPVSQVSAQVVQVNENPSSSLSAASMAKQAHQIPDFGTTSSSSMKECPDDGFNWRKYGQTQVKGSKFPRSYYKCTHLNCLVKKKVERSLEDEHVIAIIYKVQHNHQAPRSTTTNNNKPATENSNSVRGTTTWESSTAEHEAEGSSESEEADNEVEEKNNDEPGRKRRRNTEAMVVSKGVTWHRTAMESRIIVQTTSEVALLDDGYRWRKYGQKVVKGNPFPRSYYKGTTAGCNVRKHVERASSDPKAVITTYDGKHNHDVPAAKTNSHTIANNSSASQLIRPHNPTIPDRHSFNGGPIGSNHHYQQQQQQPVARLRLKEEQVT